MLIKYNVIVAENNETFIFNNAKYNGFYISYNDIDVNIYGDITTALVLGQMQKFFILNGNHSANYKKLINNGFSACIDYFKNNIELINKYSDKL